MKNKVLRRSGSSKEKNGIAKVSRFDSGEDNEKWRSSTPAKHLKDAVSQTPKLKKALLLLPRILSPFLILSSRYCVEFYPIKRHEQTVRPCPIQNEVVQWRRELARTGFIR